MEGRIKKINILVMIVLFFLSNTVLAKDSLEIRELDTNFLDITDVNTNNIYKSEDIKKLRENSEVIDAPVLKGGISELKAIVGKSQILKFDTPIKRLSITKTGLIDFKFLSPKELIMNGQAIGETTVIIWGEGEQEPVFFNLFVENNNISTKTNFIRDVRKIAPNENIKIEFVDSVGDGKQAILTGTLSSTILKEKIDELATTYGVTIVDLMEVLTPQVLLEVKIVEVKNTKNKTKMYNVHQGLFEYLNLKERGDFDQTFTTANGKDDPWLVNAALDAQTWANRIGGNVFNSDGFTIWKTLPLQNLAYTLQLAESKNLVKVISEPRVMAAHKQSATFKSVEQIPIKTLDPMTNAQSYNYIDVGTTINITPEIHEKNERIILDITAEVSEIGSLGDPPSISTRNTTTKVEVKNNETTVITGLVRKSETNSIKKFPFLSNLPVIGKLFDSTTFDNAESELMFFITPSIVKPDLASGS